MKSFFALLVPIALIVFGLAAAPLQAAQDAVYEYPFLTYSAGNVAAFVKMALAEQEDVIAELTKKYADKPEKVQKAPAVVGYAFILSNAADLQKRMDNPALSVECENAFVHLQRLHYSILADRTQGKMEPRLKRGLKMLGNILGKSMVLDVPDMDEPQAPLGEKAAALEGSRLFKPGESRPVVVAELAKMSALDVSRLQPSSDHVALSGKAVGNNYEAWLCDLTKLIRACDSKLSRFDFAYARRVMFFDEVKEDATSPKIRVKDRFGQTWAMKWGDEVHTDVALTRVAIDLGASYEDPKFYSGPGETILVLDPPSKTKEGAVHSYAQLSEMLLNSIFEFHADRYLLPGNLVKDSGGAILGHGVVDEKMIERESLDAKYLGAPYVLFKECQLSFFNPAVKRLGGAALGNVGAVVDRVARGSIVFNTWIKNKDMKDDNSRVALLYDTQTGKFDRMVEYQSDIGCALGSLKPSGELNSFEASFVKIRPRSIGFSMQPLYVPNSWKACTWADARWMALRIARLTRADLERCFAESGWPVFVQRVAVEKLISRRNELVAPFRLDLDGIKPLPCDAALTQKVSQGGREYQPVVEGRISESCPLVKELEASGHPEGLAKIITRKND